MSKPAGATKKTTPDSKRGDVGAWKEPFLVALSEAGAVTVAAKQVQINRATVYEARERDTEFRAAMETVQQACIEQVEATLFQRARDGVSDTAVIFFLKSRKPEQYGDRLRFEERETIRKAAREELLAELQAEMRELTPGARKALMAAIPSG
jgi:hypothetical protein